MSAQAIDSVARVRLLEKSDEKVVVGIGGTNYQIHLVPTKPVSTEAGKRVSGTIALDVWKVDYVESGGAYIEPVYGRPRRIQGRVIDTNEGTNTVVIEVIDTPMVAKIPGMEPVSRIKVGQLLAVEVRDGSTFDPAN